MSYSLDMPRGNPSPKLTISVDSAVHEQVRAAAQADGVSVSAWLTSAARRALLVREGLAEVAEWERQHGRFSAAEMAAAQDRVRAELGGTRKRSA